MRGLVLALVAGAALWAEGWTMVKGSETISAPGDVVQTTDGSLWWAAGAQVYRYDGRTFQPYGEAHGLGSRGSMILAAGPDGTLLVRTTEGVFRMEGERFRKIWSGPLGHMAAGPDGLVALGTYDGRLILGKDGKWNEFQYNFRLMGQVNFDRDGALRFGCNIVICEVGREKLADWATLTEKDLRKVEPRVLPEPGMPLIGMARDRWGRVWIRDWQRLFVGERAEGPYREVKVASAGGTNPPILRLSPGRVMYFNGPDGLYWGNGKGELERAAGDDSENGGFHVAYWDKQGGIWVGRRGKGLLRREAAELLTRRWGTAEGLRDPVFGVHEWGGRTVAGTMQGVYELEAGGRRWRALPETMVKYGGTPALATARDGALLVGVNRGTPVLTRVERDGRVSKTYHVPPVQDGPNVYSLLRDPKGFLWVGSARRLYRAMENGTEVETTPVELGVRPLGANVYSMLLDEKLRLLAPTTYGLFRVDGEKVERWTAKDGFRFERMQYIGRDGKGRYWVSYADKAGVARVEVTGAGLRVEHPAEEVELGTMVDILGDRRGWVWLTDDRGTWVNRTGGLEAAAFQRVGENVPEMARGGNSMSLFEDAAGRIWIGGAEGLARVEDPERFVEEDVETPPVVVGGLAFSGYAGEGLAARLSTAWLRGMDGVRYRWRLGGAVWQVSEDGTVRVGAVPGGILYWRRRRRTKRVRGGRKWCGCRWFRWCLGGGRPGFGGWLG